MQVSNQRMEKDEENYQRTMVEYTCDFLRLQATHNIKEFEEQTFARSNVWPNMMLNACVGEYHEGDTRIDFGEDLEHINEFAQVEEKFCENLASKELVKAMKLLTKQHSNPYKLGWIKKGLEVKVSEVCKIPIAIGSSYRDVVSCDVVDLGASLVLIGRSWQHDVDAIHRGKKNFYVLSWYGKNIVILPNGRPLDLKTLFIRPLIEGSENSKASSF
ncbi:hypothetical protein Tco_1423778 [Tanacetum coccineum]